MSFGDLLSELAGLRTAGEASASYIRGQVITQGVRAGESANSILAGLSSLGIGVRRDLGLRTISAEQTRQAAGATANQLDLTQPISELLGATPPANWTGQYVHQVAVVYRESDEEGGYVLATRTMGLKSSAILTSEEAVTAALDIINQQPTEPGSGYPVSPSAIISASLSGAWYDTQGRSVTIAGGGA